MTRLTPERIPHVLLACLLPLLLSARPALAEETTPRCALVVAGEFPVAKLLEARLLARSSETWLERSEIDRILAEKELQAAFGPAEGGNRASFGQILKADVLVLVRDIVQNKKQAAELVVAESNGGMRLLAQTVPLTDDAEADAAQLEELVAAGLAKHGEAIREIYAVPPFVNNDLGRGHDHLKEAYAKVLEQAILAEPGMLVVELAEAEALAQEYGLAPTTDGPSRPLPCYVLGAFRHEGYGEKETVTITIQIKRGEQQLQELKKTLSPGQDVSFLRKTAADLLQSGDRGDVLADAAEEARELAERGNAFLTLGNWPEAMALYEASLLLKPNQPEVRCQATRAAVELTRKARRKRDGLADATRFYCRAFEHCEALFRAGEREAFTTASRVYCGCIDMRGEGRFENMRRDSDVSAQTFSQYEALICAEAQLADAVWDRKLEQPEWETIAPSRFSVPVGFPDEEYAKLTAHIVKHQDALRERRVLESLLGGRNSLERRRFLQGLADSDGLADEIRDSARAWLSRFEEEIDWHYATPSRDDKPTSTPADTLTVLPINLSCTLNGREVTLSRLHCKALDNGIDLCWGPTYQKNWLPLTKLPKGDGLPQVLCPEISSPEAVAWDGKYAWIVDGGRLWVVEPIGGDCWEITQEHGMPVMSKGPADPIGRPTAKVVVPLGNDEALVAGDLGHAWVAHVRFNPDGRHQVRIIHEAREELPTGAEGTKRITDVYEAAWKNASLACSIGKGMLLDAGGEAESGERRVLIFRTHGRNMTLATHPLVINPKDLSVHVLETELRGGLPYQGKCLFSGIEERRFIRQLQRGAYPDFEPEVIIPEIDKGAHFLHEDTLQIMGAKWWQVDLLTHEKKCLGTVPWPCSEQYQPPKAGDLQLCGIGAYRSLGGIGYSNHFGWYANCEEYRGAEVPVRICFDGSGMSLREAIPKTASPADEEPKISTSHVVARRTQRKEMLWKRNGNRYYTDLAYSPDGSLIVTTCCQSPCVQVWEASTGLLIADLVDHSDSMRSVRFDRSGKYFATAGAEESMFLWSTETLELLHHVEGTPRKVSGVPALAFSRDGTLLTVCKDTMPKSASIWKTMDGTRKKKIEIVRAIVNAAEFTPDQRYLLTFGNSPGHASLWNLETGKTAGTIETLRRPLGLLPDGELLSIASNLQRSLIAWDFKRNTYRVVWERSPRHVLAVSPDGKYLLERRGPAPTSMGPASLQYTLWNIQKETEVAATRGAVGVNKWRFSPDGKTVVGVCLDGTLWRWDLTRRPAREEMRTWTDASGQFHAEATFEELTRDGVRLKRKDGPFVLVPLEKLSVPCREFLASIPTDELAPKRPTSREEVTENGEGFLEGFGRRVDPDEDCTFDSDRWTLTIDVPGTLHDLRSETGKMNSPRVVRQVDSDFSVSVAVDGQFAPKNEVIEGHVACHSAGIVAMLDEKTYLRVEHSAVKRPGQDEVQHFVRVEFRRNGAIVPGCDRSYFFEGVDITNVGLERRGSEFIPRFIGRGSGTQPLPSIRILLPPDLTVGLTVVNTSSEPFSPTFSQYRFLETK